MKGRIYAVHYGKELATTQRFVKSVMPLLGEGINMVIINNEVEFDLSALQTDFISVVNSEINRGYFGAAKFGTELYPYDNLDFIIVCNNDLEIESPDFFQILEEKMKRYDVVAPSTKTLDGIEQNPHREHRPSKFRKLYYKLYFSGYAIAWLLDKAIMFKKNLSKSIATDNTEREVFSPHGAFMIFNQTYFQKGGNIDHEPFLYGEEDSIAAQADKLKMKIGFVPTLKILHLESQSTGKGVSRKKFIYQKKAYNYIQTKFPWIYN